MTDNVRKIFDMLGVEPNEEFNMLLSNSSFPLKCKIDDNLEGYYLMFGRWELYDKLIIDLFNSRMKIIKLPKTKKKKIGDLTIREAKEIQNKICDLNIGCEDCPFYDCCINDCIDFDQEIEVEE